MATDEPISPQAGHVQLTSPSDAGAVAMSFRTEAGSGVCSTRQGPSAPSRGDGGNAMHVVTPETRISTPSAWGSFHVTVILIFASEGYVMWKSGADGANGTASGVALGRGFATGDETRDVGDGMGIGPRLGSEAETMELDVGDAEARAAIEDVGGTGPDVHAASRSTATAAVAHARRLNSAPRSPQGRSCRVIIRSIDAPERRLLRRNLVPGAASQLDTNVLPRCGATVARLLVAEDPLLGATWCWRSARFAGG